MSARAVLPPRARAVAAAGAVLLAAVLVAPVRPASTEAPVARALVVERAGTVRVALPAADYGPDDGFEVLAPDGGRVPARLVALDDAATTRAARVIAVESTAGGWWLIVDAGAAPPTHQGLRLPLAAPGLVSVELAASADRRTWSPLASAALFRLGDEDELRGSLVAYEPTAARYLRLRWPTSATTGEAPPAADAFPRLEQVAIELAAAPGEEVALDLAACAVDGPRRARCELPTLGGRAVESLSLTLPAGRAVGWRLREAVEGRWRLRGEGAWLPVGGAPARRLPLAGTAADRLRLELWGESAAPLPTRLVARLVPLALELEATVVGSYELRSGRGLIRPSPVAGSATAPAGWVVPGPPRPLPLLSPPSPVVGAWLPKAPFARHWQVRVEAPLGAIVRLPLPAAVEAAARSDLADLRLARQGRQVPYLVEEATSPQRIAAWPRLQPARSGQGRSAVALSLPRGSATRGGDLLLRVPARPLRRDVRLRVAERRAGAGPVPTVATPWQRWSCAPTPPLPCELALTMPPTTGDAELHVELLDGDNAPMTQLAAELWRPRRDLLFPWPGPPLALLAGSPRLSAPGYDLEELSGELRSWPAQLATLGPAAEGQLPRPVGWPRWAVLTSLALAAAALLLLLARALPRIPAAERRG